MVMIGIQMANTFLSNYVQTLTSRSATRVSNLVQSATLGKSDLTTLAANLNSINNFGAIQLTQQPQAGLLNSGDWQLNIRNISTILAEYFNVANQIGQLLDTDQKILNAQLQSLVKQVSAMEKQAANYSFLLADGGTFNYAYMESFHDTLGQATFSYNIPDRSGQTFDPTLEIATILTDEGALVLPDDINNSLALSASVLSSNLVAYTTSDTGIANCLNASSATGWRLAASTPTPITASLSTLFQGYTGAQVALEFTLSAPSPCTSVKLTPLAAEAVDLVGVTAYSNVNDQVGTQLLTAPQSLSQATNIHFPLTNVQRVRVYLNQSSYTRTAQYTNADEETYRQLYNYNAAQTNSSTSYVAFSGSQESITTLPNYSLASQASYAPDIVDSLRIFKTQLGIGNYWTQYSIYDSSFLSLYSQWNGVFKTIFPTSQYTGASSLGQPLASAANNSPSPIAALPAVSSSTISSSFNYEYVLGLQYFGIGIDVPSYKGVFVSVVIPSPGDMGEVMMKTVDSNYISADPTLDNPILTSIEYSVTNASNPALETDWDPILPINYTSVQSERLFPDNNGNCIFRFLGAISEQVSVYKNGHATTSFNTNTDSSGNNYVGVSIQPNTYTAQDILTASYTPSGTPTLIDFTSSGFSDAPLASASDSNGAGEGFPGTSGRNSIQLSQQPYINASEVAISTYAPITVILQDGTTAINMTNYKTGQQPIFPNTGYYYIQSGNVLMFNQPINEAFRVYYQYIQNNVRFRVVERVNSSNFVSPKVNSVQIKAQTRQANITQQ